MKNKNVRLTRSAVFVLTLICAVGFGGCATSGNSSRTLDGYNSLPDSPVKSAFRKQLAHGSEKDKALENLPEMGSEDLERAGDMHLMKGELFTAYVQYEKALALKPNDTRLIFKKGLLFLLSGKHEDAAKEFRTVIEREPAYASAHEGLGQALFRMRKYEEAEKSLLTAVKLDPRLWKAKNFLGNIYDHQGKYDLARNMYAEAILINPREASLYNNLGVSLSLAGDYEAAVEAFMQGLRSKGAKEKIYNNLGLTLAKMGQYDAALEAFKKGTDSAKANNNLGCMYMADGKYEEAARYFKRAIEASPEFYVKADDNLKKLEFGASGN